jgi:UDP-N-acetylmuramoylalanine--D-glutamate ligase
MKIAIAGYGVEGEENYAYWSADPANEITIVDEKEVPAKPLPQGAAALLGPGVFERLEGFDLVIRTASLPPRNIKTDGKVWSATNEFYAKCPAPIIGITGTKGKGTTSSIIAALFEAAGGKVWLVGNIGIAAISVLDQIQAGDVVVFEMSSFQLWDIERSPQTAVVLLIEPDHLNVHAGMEDYVHAKGGITRHQTQEDICVYHPTNTYSKQVADESAATRKERYATQDGNGVYVADGMFRTHERVICSTDALHLRGEHNKENACAAITVALAHGLSDEVIERGLRHFEGLPHRLEYVRTIGGVDYYNDSYSSAPAATVAAINSFETPEIVVVGGVDKGFDLANFAHILLARTNIKEIVLIGEVRHKLYEFLKAKSAASTAAITVFDGTTMPEIVRYLQTQAAAGDTVIFSPGCASFDMFKDFSDRGTQFRNEVLGL